MIDLTLRPRPRDGANKVEPTRALTQQGNLETLIGEMHPTLVNYLKTAGTTPNDVQTALGMHAETPARLVTVEGTYIDLYRSTLQALEDWQPSTSETVKNAKKLSLYHRMRLVEAELRSSGIDPYTHIRQWNIVLDASVADASPSAHPTAQAEGSLAASRVKAVVPEGEGMSFAEYNAKLTRSLKSQGGLAGVGVVFAALGLWSAHQAMENALPDEKTRAELTYGTAITGAFMSAFEVLRVAIEKRQVRTNQLLGTIGTEVAPRFLKFVKVGGSGLGAVTLGLAAVVDTWNATDAASSDEDGLATLYAAKAFLEGGTAIAFGYNSFALLVTGEGLAILGGPVIWIIMGIIVASEIVINVVADPKTLAWTKDCFLGISPNPDYDKDHMLEQKNYRSAMAQLSR